MNAPASVADVLARHVRLELECIDRLYLNVYQPRLQHECGIAAFFRYHCGYRYPSSALMDPISKRFWGAVQTFIQERRLPLVVFKTRQRKGQVARQYRSRFRGVEGVLFVARAWRRLLAIRRRK